MPVLFIHDEKYDDIQKGIEVSDHLRVEISIRVAVSAV
jgi:hypothetical protein